MLRDIPVDQGRTRLISAVSAAAQMPEWGELSDGSRRPTGNQAREKHEDGTLGAPLWQVDCLIAGGDRGSLVSVQIASTDEPKVAELAPVVFTELTVRPVVGRADGKLKQYWSATGVDNGKAHHQPPKGGEQG